MNHTITQTRYLTQTIKQKVYIFCTRKRMRSTKPKQTYREETTITIIILSTTKARAFKNTWKLLPICKNGGKDYGISLNVTQLYRSHTSSQFHSKNISRVYVSYAQVKTEKVRKSWLLYNNIYFKIGNHQITSDERAHLISNNLILDIRKQPILQNVCHCYCKPPFLLLKQDPGETYFRFGKHMFDGEFKYAKKTSFQFALR